MAGETAWDAMPFPIWLGRFRVTFPIYDSSGLLISGATGLDSERSLNQGTFSDCTNEATEIATSTGIYYLDLVSGELNSTSTAVQVKSTSTNARTTVLVINPLRLPIIRTGTAQAGATSSITLDAGASAFDDYYFGCYVRITNDVPTNALGQCRQIIDYVGSTQVATIDGQWGTNPSSSSTFEILAPPGVIAAASIPAPAANKIADHMLRRSYATARTSADGDTLAGRSLIGAVAHLVNRVAIAAGVKTVYHEDDSTTLFTATITSNPAADPITQVDPT